MGIRHDLKQIADLGGLSLKELGKRVWNEMGNDDVSAYAAQLAYYFLFSLFPFLLFLAALIGYLPIPDLMTRIFSALESFLPREAMSLVQDNVVEVVTSRKGGLLSVGAILALWGATGAMSAIMTSLNRAYGVREGRPFWKSKLIALGLTLLPAVMALAAIVLLMFGPQIGHWLAAKVGLGGLFDFIWIGVRWIAIVFGMVLAIALIYYFAPDVKQKWRWITPGALFAVLAWILMSAAFSYYVNNFGSYSQTYGTIGGVIALLSYLYLCGLVLLIGGEINSEIEHAADTGKAEGERAPGQPARAD